MTSRLDRLFVLLENCPNATLRNTASNHLADVVRHNPSEIKVILNRLINLSRSKNWTSRIAASNAISDILLAIEPWKPSVVEDTTQVSSDTNEDYLSLERLDLKEIISLGTRLYSVDVNELVESEMSILNKGPSGAKDDSVKYLFGKNMSFIDGNSCDFIQPEDFTLDKTQSKLSVNNRFSLKKLIEQNFQNSKEQNDEEPPRKRVKNEPSSDDDSTQDWPLKEFYHNLLEDLWSLNWEVRHGSSSCLRELVSSKVHIKSAGLLNRGSTEALHSDHEKFLEDLAVRVLVTLSLDQFSDFIMDEVVAPVRETTAQLLGVLSTHFSLERVLILARHFISLINYRERIAEDRTAWMIVHGGLLGLKYLIAARRDIWDALLPVICPVLFSGLTNSPVWPPSLETCNDYLKRTEKIDNCFSYPGSEDILGATVETLLHLTTDSAFFSQASKDMPNETDASILHKYISIKLWSLLAESSDLSPAIGPLLKLISALSQSESSFAIIIDVDVSQSEIDMTSILEANNSHLETSLKHIIRLVHHSSSAIRRLAIETLKMIIEFHKNYQFKTYPNQRFYVIPVSLLYILLDQIFQRVLIETAKSVIVSCIELWDKLIQYSSIDALVAASIGRIDFWLCQSMQPTKQPFASTMIDILNSNPSPLVNNKSNSDLNSITTPQVQFYLGGSESINMHERKREFITLETRITCVGMLGQLCGKICQSDKKIMTSHEEGPKSDNSIYPIVYILRRILLDMHLADRQAIQRFIGAILLGCFASIELADNFKWSKIMSADLSVAPPNSMLAELKGIFDDLSKRLYKNLTEVIYYDEILECFKIMHRDSFDLFELMKSSGKFEGQELNSICPENSKVLNISQCQRLLAHYVKIIDKIESESLENGNQKIFEDLSDGYCKAKSGLDRCLEIQLFLCSRVELATSSSMVQCNTVPTGQLTLLIRPLMDCIRGKLPIPSLTSDARSNETQDHIQTAAMLKVSFPCAGHTYRFQKMAALSLANLLYNDWMRNTIKTNPKVNNSKAAKKVFMNLITYLLNSDPLLLFCQNDKALLNTTINLHGLLYQEETIIEDLKPQVTSNSARLALNGKKKGAQSCETQNSIDLSEETSSNASHSSGTQEVFKFHSDSSSVIRYRGSSYALLHLFYTISDNGKSLKDLKYGLPYFYEKLFIEPFNYHVKILKTLCNENLSTITIDTLDDDVCMKKFQELIATLDKNFNKLLVSRTKDHEGDGPFDFLSSVCLQTLIYPFYHRYSTDSLEMKLLLAQYFVKTALFYLFSKTGMDPNTDLSNQLATARLILVVLESSPMPVLLLNGLLDVLTMFQQSLEEYHRLCLVTIIWYIFKNLLDIEDNSSSRLFRVVNTFWTHVDETEKKGSDRTESSLINHILPFSVICLSMSLKLQSDSSSRIRNFSSFLFTNLLVLMPLESSLPDPDGISEVWQEKRIKERAFIDCLLNPSQIKSYKSFENIINAKLRPYQQDGVNWLAFLNQYNLHGILCDDLGLGKTLQSICILSGDHYDKFKRDPEASYISLIVCPSTLKWHWYNEIKNFVHAQDERDNLRPFMYNRESDISCLISECGLPANVVIMSYDQMRQKNDFIGSVNWNYLILDEGHVIKNSKTKLSIRLRALKSQHRLILTGTPIQNHVNEIWSLFEFLMPGFLGSESHFNSRFVSLINSIKDPKASKADHTTGQIALERLHKVILPFMLRRLKEDVLKDLPPKIIQDYICELTPLQERLYEHSKQRAHDLSNESNAIGFEKTQYLQAVCNHPCLVMTDNHPLYPWFNDQMHKGTFGPNCKNMDDLYLSGKLIALIQLLTECGFREGTSPQESGYETSLDSNNVDQSEIISPHRLLIFTKTKKMLSLVERLLQRNFPSISFLKMYSDLSSKERFEMVQRFNSDITIDILILTTSIGGLGLNLTGADTVIFVENDWNPTKDQQAMDRAHRIGQKKTVNVYRLITKRTIEEEILSLQNFKSHLANTIINAENSTFSGTQSHVTTKDGSILDNMSNKNFSLEKISNQEASEEEHQYSEEYSFDTFLKKIIQ